MYGKFKDGVFELAPYRITEQEALERGYKPVVLTPAPEAESGYMPVEWLEERENDIMRHWNIVPMPEPTEDLTPEEALSILLGGDGT